MNPKAQRLIAGVEQEIQYALEDLVMGQNLHAGLGAQIKRTVHSILYRQNIRKSHIFVQRQGNGFVVTVSLPPQGPIVQTVQLNMNLG
jgi:hypothetical protein